MKIQIDTKNKFIKVLDAVKIEELLSNLKKLFPDGEYKKYTLETNVTVEWSYPIVYRDYTPWIQPWSPNVVTYSTTKAVGGNSGTTLGGHQMFANGSCGGRGATTEIYNVEI